MISAGSVAICRFIVYPFDNRMMHFNFKSTGGRAAFKFFDSNGTEITDFDVFQSQTSGSQTIGSDTINTFGNKKDGYNILIPNACTEIWAGIYASSNCYVESISFWTDAVISMVEHNTLLASIPTRNGKRTGQIAYKTGGGYWLWNGSSWDAYTP